MKQRNLQCAAHYLMVRNAQTDFSSLRVAAWRTCAVSISLIVLSIAGWYGCGKRNQSTASFHVYSTVDTTEAAIGDIIHFQVWAKATGDRIISFPSLAVDNPDIEIGEGKELRGEYDDDHGMEFAVTFWDTGHFELPSYSVNIMDAENKSIDYSISTDPVTVNVRSVITDAQPALRDIKPPVPIPFVIPMRLLLSIVAIVVLLGLLVWLWRQRVVREGSEPEIYVPSRPPHEIATEKLRELQGMKLDSSHRIKRFYSELSHITREYLEYQYFLRAIEMTTSEIEEAKYLIPLSEEEIEGLLGVLRRSDLAKFARFQPGVEQCATDLDAIFRFVEVSRIDWSLAQNGVQRAEAT